MNANSLGSIIVIDDDPQMRAMLIDHLELSGYQVRGFADGLEAMQFLLKPSPESDQVELVLTDLRMPEMDGVSVLQQIKSHRPTLPVILMTAFASVDTAIEGLRKGAFDYITKPFKLSEMSISIERALTFSRLQQQNKALSIEVKKQWGYKELLGKSAAMKAVFEVIEAVAPSNSNVLITGETGTGKEMVAKTIHMKSPRAQKPFVAINCSAIPENLLESELFGHVKGAFTGAVDRKKGLFEEAQGGTLFLDEIGDMELSLQAKLLRVLQERQIRAVGDTQSKEINVRVIAATHKDLKKAIQAGTFREDLFYRLSVIPIVVPPLRHRTEDIPLLALHFLHKYSILNGGRVHGFSQDALFSLMNRSWPGNVRELENLVERMVVLAKTPQIQVTDIPRIEDQEFEGLYSGLVQGFPTLEDLEKRYIQVILEKTGGKKEKAAQILGINRRTLYRKEKDYGFAAGEEPAED